MADGVVLSAKPQSVAANKKANFEEMVKDRLSWSRRTWSERGEVDSSMHKMVNSVKYWGGTLKRAHGKNNVVVGLFNEQRKVNVNLMDFIDEFDRMGVGHKLVGFTNCRNPRYLSFHFDTPETKKYVEENLKILGDSYVIYLEWALASVATVVKFHWVPLDFPTEKIIGFITTYGKTEEWIREEFRLMDGRVLKNGTVTVKISKKEDVDIKNIPHLCIIDGLELLINIAGRQIMCLNCNGLGHKSSECPTPYCGVCKRMQNRTHKCEESVNKKLSYANVVNNSGGNEMVDAIKEGATGLSSKILWNTKRETEAGKRFWEKPTVKQGNTSIADSWKGEDLVKKDELGIFDWADQSSENNNAEQSGDDYIDSDDSGAAVEKMRNYCKELERIKEEANILNKVRDAKSLRDLKKETISCSNDTLITGSDQLKRKLMKAVKVATTKVSGNANKPSLGKRGRGGGGKKKGSRVSVTTKAKEPCADRVLTSDLSSGLIGE